MRFVMLLIVFVLIIDTAHAMSRCDPPEISDYEMVFKGEALYSSLLNEEVEKIKEKLGSNGNQSTNEFIDIWVGYPTVTEFRVLELYKGEPVNEIKIYHSSKSVLGMDFLDDNKYLIHSNKSENWGGNYTVGRCGFESINEDNPSKAYTRARGFQISPD
ncbi:MAG: hypothetical protein ACK4NR_07815 [Micavibrio sp.]